MWSIIKKKYRIRTKNTATTKMCRNALFFQMRDESPKEIFYKYQHLDLNFRTSSVTDVELGLGIGLFYFIFLEFIYFDWRLITLQYCIVFAIHQHESAIARTSFHTYFPLT